MVSCNRKEKSLATISDKFLEIFHSSESDTDIKLDETAIHLGVKKRRMYDIVGVMESVGIIEKKGVSCYRWKGLSNLDSSLLKLKREAVTDLELKTGIENLPQDVQHDALKACLIKFTVKNDTQSNSSESDESYDKKKKREKALSQLSKRLVQLFLISEQSEISYNQSIAVLIDYDTSQDSSLRTKTRRLYDIANILSSIDLIRRSNHFQGKKETAFQWIHSQSPASFQLANVQKRPINPGKTSFTPTVPSMENCNQDPQRTVKLKGKRPRTRSVKVDPKSPKLTNHFVPSHSSTDNVKILDGDSKTPPLSRSKGLYSFDNIRDTPRQLSMPIKKRKTFKSAIFPSPDVENEEPIYNFIRASPHKEKKRRRRSNSEIQSNQNFVSVTEIPLCPTKLYETPNAEDSQIQRMHFRFTLPLQSLSENTCLTNNAGKQL